MNNPMKCPDCKELVLRAYWLRDQLPPKNWECRCGHEESHIQTTQERDGKCPDCGYLYRTPRSKPCGKRKDEENQLGHWSQQLDDDEEAIEEFCVF